ncbi:hypothetical protein [Bradyrhizobium elkanii]|uniref:hypothetical protein n=1 Tax=Bradyrhizobium elkanii TaxID=29448 RepID=UPI00114C911A|nr:hypothetical protein [Bradyrhizobium elkanii]
MSAQSNTQDVKVGIEQGAKRLFVKSGGTLDIEDGGVFSVAGVPLKVARGQLTTVTAADTVVTGLASVAAVIVSLESDPGDDPFMVSAQIGDQAGAPAAGSIIIKTWKNTGGTDPTPVAATTFVKKVNWVAIGS